MRKLKQRLKVEGSEVVTHCHELKLIDEDGKRRLILFLDQNDIEEKPGLPRSLRSLAMTLVLIRHCEHCALYG